MASAMNNGFSHIFSATSLEDRASLLAVQEAAGASGPYRYLEIGSHLGGTIQPHISDPRCELIYSIDKRSHEQPDERGRSYRYGEENSTKCMIENLSAIPGADLGRLKTFESDASEVPAAEIDPPTYCFVDGEHTDRAVQSDFAFCETVSQGRLVFVSHDAFVLYRGLHAIISRLVDRSQWFRAFLLPSHLFLIDTVGQISNHPAVIARALEGWRGYLEGMLINDWYREEFLKICQDPESIAI
jgi:hypothetical protein